VKIKDFVWYPFSIPRKSGDHSIIAIVFYANIHLLYHCDKPKSIPYPFIAINEIKEAFE
jgi:hypothetical protein